MDIILFKKESVRFIIVWMSSIFVDRKCSWEERTVGKFSRFTTTQTSMISRGKSELKSRQCDRGLMHHTRCSASRHGVIQWVRSSNYGIMCTYWHCCMYWVTVKLTCYHISEAMLSSNVLCASFSASSARRLRPDFNSALDWLNGVFGLYHSVNVMSPCIWSVPTSSDRSW